MPTSREEVVRGDCFERFAVSLWKDGNTDGNHTKINDQQNAGKVLRRFGTISFHLNLSNRSSEEEPKGRNLGRNCGDYCLCKTDCNALSPSFLIQSKFTVRSDSFLILFNLKESPPSPTSPQKLPISS